METTVTGCIVHDRKYLSKFHATVNQLRRTNEFSHFILQQLPKLCCSCHGQTRYMDCLLRIDQLHKRCDQMQISQKTSSMIFRPAKYIHCVPLEFSSMLNHVQRDNKAARFVGQGGKQLRLLQYQLNIRINIINEKSCTYFRRIVDQFKRQNKQSHINALWVLITMKKSHLDEYIQKVKQLLKKRWRKSNVLPKQKRPTKTSFSRKTTTKTSFSQKITTKTSSFPKTTTNQKLKQK